MKSAGMKPRQYINKGRIHIVSSGINGNQTQQLSLQSHHSLLNASLTDNNRHVMRNLQVADQLKQHNCSQRNSVLGPSQALDQTPESHLREQTSHLLGSFNQ
jgi:hypothetical protein